MEFLIKPVGFENQQLIIKGPGFLMGPSLYVDGVKPNKGPKRFQYVLRRDDGFKVIAEVRPVFLDPIPKVIIDEEVISLAEPLNIFQWIWSGLPILLVFVGGMIGGFLGGSAFWFNTRIFRSKEVSEFEKYILTGAVTVIVGLGWFIALFLLGSFFAGDF
jgi:hypothetical protein